LPFEACCFLIGTFAGDRWCINGKKGDEEQQSSEFREGETRAVLVHLRGDSARKGGELLRGPGRSLRATLVRVNLQERTAPAPHGPVEQPLRVLMPSPIGGLGVELRGTTVTRLLIEPGEEERVSFLALHEIEGSDFLDEVFGRLSEYFAGARRKLELEYNLGLCGVDCFTRRVLKETAKVPYGKTRTCQEIAEAAGRPAARREVLSALLGNPIPILIPCHRVISGMAGLDSYVGGSERKRWLLEMERQATEIS
jgi:methylated-DNA-[protein]-cysteine S-methyltransferase